MTLISRAVDVAEIVTKRLGNGAFAVKNISITTEQVKSIETGDPKPLTYINPNKYIQHNLAVADGLIGVKALLQSLPKGSAKVQTVRVFQDGDFVFAHTDYNFFGPKVGFDIFRFEEGKIVEHWDNLQETATSRVRAAIRCWMDQRRHPTSTRPTRTRH